VTDDPRTFDYSSPRRSCDVVMKGGITSGVVYPHAVCELARTYRLCSVGGTSAGAIAAAVAGAAELGRGSGGFAKLAALPSWISSDQHLFELFQPQPRTRRLYRVLTAGLGGGLRAKLRILLAAVASHVLPAGEYDRREDPATGRRIVVAGTYHAVAARPVEAFRALVDG